MDIASEPYVDLKVSPTVMNFCDDRKQLTEVPSKMSVKRSFDVAFLMLPDEKLKHRKEGNVSPELNVSTYPLTELSVRSDLMNHYNHVNKMINNQKNEYLNANVAESLRYGSMMVHHGKTATEKSEEIAKMDVPRSAFSKVPQIINVESSVSPPISPDQLSCSSASPPISYSPPSTSFRPEYANFINSSAFQAFDRSSFATQGKFRQLLYRNNCNQIEDHHIEKSNNEQAHLQSFQFGHANSHAVFMSQPEQFIRNPAAAILSTLLPTTLGALSLPAQNVCAKCNISFRMTSDLVYHMRSHHKNEANHDPNKRKREEKLKCPVCSESFRERHHLTRHMTAHQDKEGDLLDHEIAEFHSRRK